MQSTSARSTSALNDHSDDVELRSLEDWFDKKLLAVLDHLPDRETAMKLLLTPSHDSDEDPSG